MNRQYEDILNILTLLQTQQVTFAQQRLNQYPRQLLITMLTHILRDHNIQNQLRLASSVILNNKLCQNLLENSQLNYYQFFFSILSDNMISNAHKRNFQRSLICTLQLSQQEYLKKWLELTLKLLNSQLYDPAYFIIACFGVADIGSQYLFVMITNTYEYTLQNCPLGLQNVIALNELLKTWIVIIDKLLTEQGQDYNNILLNMISSQALYKIINWVFSFQIQGDIIVCMIKNLQQLNLLKFQSGQLLQRVLNFGLKTKKQIPAFVYVQKILPNIIKTLVFFSKHKKLIEKYQCNNLLIILLKILQKYFLKQKKIQQQLWINILNFIVYPFIQVDQNQKIQFQQQFQEFDACMEDCCDQQNFGTLKSQNCRLLQIIGNTNKQSIQYTILRCIQSLKIKFNLNNHITNQQQKILQIQTTFLLLSILSYKLGDYPIYIAQLKIILSNEQIYKMLPFETARLFQFLAYSYGDLFPVPNQGAQLINKALKYQGHYTTALCGLDFLSNIAQQYYSEQFLRVIADKIVSLNHGYIWQIITRILHSHHHQITEPAMGYLINQIFKRIDLQFEPLLLKNKTDTLPLINCFHILKKILSYTLINQKYLIKQMIWKIINYFQNSKLFSIDDQIVSIITQFLKQQIKLQEYLINLLPMLLKSYQQQQYQVKPYIILFNGYIMKGKLNQIIQLIKILLKGCSYHIQNLKISPKKIKSRYFLGHHFILLQNFLAIHGTQIQNQIFFSQIYDICIQTLPQDNNNTTFDKVICSRALNLLFLCYMHIKVEKLLNVVINFHQKDFYQGYDCKVMVQCLSKQIFMQNDPVMVAEMINMIVRIIIQSQKNKQKQQQKKKKQLKNKQAKLKQFKLQNYQIILRNIQVPFNKNLDQNQQLKNIINIMKSNNQQLYSTIVQNLAIDIKQYLSNLLKKQQIKGNKIRTIYKITGTKKIPQNIDQQHQQQHQNQQDKDSQLYKRRRVKLKKDQKQKQSK